MIKLWALLGNIAFWASWPLLFVYLYFSARTRVLVVAGDQVLVVKGWLGSGAWDLPGGGLHRHETPDAGVLRELDEETGLRPADRPQLLHAGRAKNGQGLGFTLHAFVLELDKPQPVTPQKFELVDARWIPWRDLYNDPQIGPDIKGILTARFKA